MEILSRRIKDGRVLSLIHKYIRAGVVVGHKFLESKQGVPLSPLLSNIMLNELDKELEHRGHPFVRYADDCMIFCKSKRAAERTKKSIIEFIESKLYLRVNLDKTTVGYVYGKKFLGYSFYVSKGVCRLSVHPESVTKMKARLKELTSRSNGCGHETRKSQLRQFIVGWVEYFKLADVKQQLSRIDEWLRSRIRMCIWKCLKKVKPRYNSLMRYGIEKDQSWIWANTRKGYWCIAGSPIVNRSIITIAFEKPAILCSQTIIVK